METSEITRIPGLQRDLQGLIKQRNELARFVRGRVSLPPMLTDQRMCERCYAKTPCFIYQNLTGDSNGITSGLSTKFKELVSHLEPQHQVYFSHWDHLITKEE